MEKEDMRQILTIRPCTKLEAEYAYAQPSAIRLFSGGMGYIRGDFDSDGKSFFTRSFLTEEGFLEPVITQEVKDAINDTINALRLNPETGMPLRDRVSMKRYQGTHPGYDLGQKSYEYRETAIRVDNSKNLTIILRLKPRRGDYDFYAHCFNTRALDRIIEGRLHGIDLKTPATDKLLVHLNEGDSLRILSKTGEIEKELQPVYLNKDHFFAYGFKDPNKSDEYFHHMELTTLPFMEGNEKELIPVRKALPNMCYGVDPKTNSVIEIEKAKKEYRVLEGAYESYEDASKAADELNKTLPDVLRPTDRRMMEAGIFKGWAHPDADPSTYMDPPDIQKDPEEVIDITQKTVHTDYDVPFGEAEVEVIPFKYEDPFGPNADENGMSTEWAACDRRGLAVAFGNTKEDCADAAEELGYSPAIGFIIDFYVIEGGEKRPFPALENKRYDTLEEAVTQFKKIPPEHHAFLGIDKRIMEGEKFGGACDLLYREPGRKVEAVKDWKNPLYGNNWDNVEVRSAYLALCKEFGIEDKPKRKKSRKNAR